MRQVLRGRRYDRRLPLNQGTRLGHYEITGELSAGGMGVVYRALDVRLKRAVAIKVIAADAVADPDRKQRFIREARAASALSHPNIVTIHDVGEVDGIDYLVMELVDGQTLEHAIPPDGLSIDRVLAWGAQIASALDAAHSAGIVHRDIKPANIIITNAGQAKVLDFGLAKRLDRILDDGATTAAATLASRAGSLLGTIAYMSPEQAQGLPLEARTDIFSFGAVLHEMVTGRRAFSGPTALATLSSILGDQPATLQTLRKGVPGELSQLVQACLSKDPTQRPSARQVLDRLTALRPATSPTTASAAAVLRRPAVALALAVVAVSSVSIGLWRWQAGAPVRWARNVAIPEVRRRLDRDDYDGAYRIAREAIAIIPADERLRQLWTDLTFVGRIDTDPPGADVSIRGYLADEHAEWIPLGRTPLVDVRLPMGALRVRISKEGYGPLEVANGFFFRYTLDPQGSAPARMVRVAGATTSTGTATATVKDFWFDEFEVTNRQYKTFVDAGGYRSREYWREPLVDRGRVLSWEEAMSRFRDTTAQPGPATWELGTYPEGEAEMPVAGVSWYEAAAYAAFVGKKLPTVFHWRAAAGMYPPTENFADHLLRSNFSGKGPSPVGLYKGLGPYGTYDLAGNVKEWCWNETDRGRLTLGGAWNETSYMFMDLDSQPAMQRLSTYGMRLMKEMDPSPPETAMRVQSVDFSTKKPVDDAAFNVLRSIYAYDDTPLNAAVEVAQDSADWRKETVSYAAAYGKERIRGYLYLPKNASPPYQAVLYFPGGDATLLRTSEDLRLRMVDFVIRSGRALLFPVYQGTYERSVTPAGPNGFRDLTIARVKDARRSIDYLVSRRDIDKDRLGFYGSSLGAAIGTIFTALEPRLKASVLAGGGLVAGKRPAETDLINFAPRIHVPTLMVNGRSDFANPYETSQLPMFRLLGPTADRKSLSTFEGGHIPLEIHQVIGRILQWFDKYLGLVSR